MTVASDTAEEDVKKHAGGFQVQSHIHDKTVRKVIVVPRKLVNIDPLNNLRSYCREYTCCQPQKAAKRNCLLEAFQELDAALSASA